MDIPRLRRLAAEVDEEHREAMRDIEARLDALHGAPLDAGVAEQRRAFLRKVATGGLVVAAGSAVLVPTLAGVAAAQETTTTGAGQTTTTFPRQVTDEDKALFSFTQSIELAAHDAYLLALEKGLPESLVPVLGTFASHHLQHGQAAAGYAGKLGTGRPNQGLMAAITPALEGMSTSNEVLRFLFDLEQAAAATYQAALGVVVSVDGAMTIASIEPIEARHAVVIAEALELDPKDYIPSFQTASDAISPEDYPVIPEELKQ